jgi:aspartate/methionine/tyrosine aminotransferase
MFGPTLYLQWAARHYGKLRFDLASSGIPTVPLTELGVPGAEAISDPTGWLALREACASYNDVPKDEAVASLGTTHALWLAYVSLAEPGDEVLVEDPAYEPLVRIAEGIGLQVVRYARPASERFALDPDRVKRAMSPRTKLVVVSDLHNPSGRRAGTEPLREVARIAGASGAFVLVDEVYGAFDELADGSGVFRGSARKLAPNVVVASSLTKCYGVGPLRVGWMLGPAEVVRRAEDAVLASCGALPLAHAHLALRAFERISPLARRAREIVGTKRERVGAWARSHCASWSDPEAGLFGFATLGRREDLTPLLERAAHQHQVLVAPGAFFGIPNGFRVAWSAPDAVLDEGLVRVSQALSLTGPA